MEDVQKFELELDHAVAEDVRDLFSAFSSGPPTFAHFLRCFNDDEFYTIFVGRVSKEIEVELLEGFFQTIAQYMFPFEKRSPAVQNKRLVANSLAKNNLERAFAVYLLFVFFFAQSDDSIVLIKLSLEHSELMPTMMEELIRDNEYQALYCLHRLITLKAFIIVKFDEEYNPQLATNLINQPVQESGFNITDFSRLNGVLSAKELDLMERAHTMRESLREELGIPSNVVNPLDNMADFMREFAQIETEPSSISALPTTSEAAPSTASRLASIRQRAYNAPATVPRHLTGVEKTAAIRPSESNTPKTKPRPKRRRLATTDSSTDEDLDYEDIEQIERREEQLRRQGAASTTSMTLRRSARLKK